MSDGRKRLSGAEYRKKAKARREQQVADVQKSKKIDAFFKSGDGNVGIDVFPDSEGESSKSKIAEDQTACSSSSDETVFLQLQPSVADTSVEKGTTHSESEKELVQCEKAAEITVSPQLKNDPALWEINDTTREIAAVSGFVQNIACDFSKTIRVYADQRRFLSKTLFQRKLKNNEVRERNWLIYSESKGSVFCGPCLLFGSLEDKSQFNDEEGFNDWKNAEVRVAQHENSPHHKSCIVSLRDRKMSGSRIDSALTVQISNEIVYWRMVLTRIVAVVKKLSSRGLPFRGSNEVFGNRHNGNFLMLLELIAEFDPFLAKHVERYGNQGTTSYLSKTICNEVIDCMAEKVLKYICTEIKNAKYFSLVVDSTPDISHVDQLTLVIRYVLETGEPCERFLKFLPSVGHKAQDMFAAITSQLELFSISLEDCRGQSYDNASNMSGMYNGLQAKIQEAAPFAFFIPCAAHSLNLVGTSAAESCAEACRFFMLLEEIYVFFVKSTQRWKKLMEKIKTAKTVKRVCPTRWSAREDACGSLKDSWDEIRAVLHAIENDASEKAISRMEAKGIRVKLQRLETAFMVIFWNVVLERFNKVSAKMQNITTDVLVISDLYESLSSFLIAERDNFEYFEKRAIEMSVTKEYEKNLKRQVKRKTWEDESPDEAMETSGRDDFRVQTFLVIVDKLVAELEKRHKAYCNFQENFSFLTKIGELSTTTLTTKVYSLVGAYPNDLEYDLVQECLHFCSHPFSKKAMETPESKTLLSLSRFLKTHSLHNVYPNLDIALRIALCIPATNCSGERSFSCLKRIKNYLRSSLCQEKLNSLALLSIESDIANSMDYDDIINDFAGKKSRKKRLM